MSSISKYPSPWSRVAREFRAMLRTLPMEVSTIAANDFRENFRRGGYINRGGVLIPWRKRATIGQGRDRTRAVLVKSGFLLRGNAPKPLHMTARVINAVPYAVAHNEGVDATVNVKAHRRGLYTKAKVSKKTKTGSRMVEQRKLKAFAKVKAFSRKMKLPRRPFMVNSPVLDRAINDHIDQRILQIWHRQ
jgi:phage gpG-like protein